MLPLRSTAVAFGERVRKVLAKQIFRQKRTTVPLTGQAAIRFLFHRTDVAARRHRRENVDHAALSHPAFEEQVRNVFGN
jgi:hypothetical protein